MWIFGIFWERGGGRKEEPLKEEICKSERASDIYWLSFLSLRITKRYY